MTNTRLVAIFVTALAFVFFFGSPAVPRADAEVKKATPTKGGKRVVKSGGDSRAWTTLRPLLPEGVVLAGQINAAALRGSESFRQLRRMVDKDRDARELVEAARSGCQIDLGEAVQDVAFAVTDGNDNQVLVALSFRGVGEAELVHCAEVVAAKKRGGPVKIESKRAGAIVEYTVPGETDKFYAAWLAPDVVAFASEPSQRAPLAALIAGKGGFAAAPTTRRAVAALAPGAAAWAVYLKPEHIDSYDLKFAAGTVGVSGGQLQLEVELFLVDADSAKRAAADWTAQKDQLAASGAPMVGQLLKSVQIVAADEVVRLTASVSEKDFLGLLNFF
jgi:hypothetical protein